MGFGTSIPNLVYTVVKVIQIPILWRSRSCLLLLASERGLCKTFLNFWIDPTKYPGLRQYKMRAMGLLVYIIYLDLLQMKYRHSLNISNNKFTKLLLSLCRLKSCVVLTFERCVATFWKWWLTSAAKLWIFGPLIVRLLPPVQV